MADDPKYKRLTRARPRARFAIISTGNSSLWLGPDHLLCIDSNGYTENYKRFYFRDIQAFIVRKTEGYKYASLVLGVIGLFLCVIAVLNRPGIASIILFSLAVFLLVCMMLNLILGPTTVCCLQTAVQVEFLPSIRRLRKARKILNLIRPMIASAQGELAPEEIARRFSGMPGMPAHVAQQPAVSEAPPIINPVPPTASDSVDARYMPPQNLS